MKTLEALTKIKEELARIGIAKDQENERFMFRSIDAMYNVLGPLFAKYGVHTIPVVEERTQEVFETAKGTKMFHVVLRVQYHLYTADPDTGRKDEMISPVVYGEALDTSDKATHKAMTQAYKYMLIQVLCIPLEAQADSDEEYLRVASYTGDEKEIYDELLAANNAFEFYVFMRSLPRAKQHALHNSHPKGDITKMNIPAKAELITDIYAAISYAANPFAVMERYAKLLKPNGQLLIQMSGGNADTIYDAKGEPHRMQDILKKVPGFQLVSAQDVYGRELLLLRRTKAAVKLPHLELLFQSRGRPPERVFRMK